MKKCYQAPVAEAELLNVSDILTSSFASKAEGQGDYYRFSDLIGEPDI